MRKSVIVGFLLVPIMALAAFWWETYDPGASGVKMQDVTVVAAGGGIPTSTLVEHLEADTLGLTNNAPVATFTATVGTDLTATGGERPLYKTSVQNGLDILSFNGTANKMGASFTTETQPFTVGVVWKTITTGNDDAIFAADTIATRFMNRATGTFWGLFADGAAYVSGGTSDTTWHIALMEFNGATSKFALDGASYSTLDMTGHSGSLDGLTIGALEGAVGFFGEIQMGEIAVWGQSLDASDQSAWWAYANGKWAVY